MITTAYVETRSSIFGPSPQIKSALLKVQVSLAVSTVPLGCRTNLFAESVILSSEIDGARKSQDDAIVGIRLFRFIIAMDGNCLFRSIGAHLLGQDIHLQLREAAAS